MSAHLLHHALQDSNATAASSSGLKVEALQFTRMALANGASAPPAKDLKQLTVVVLPCATERYYKVCGFVWVWWGCGCECECICM
jgi:hypothetical protein